MKGVRERLVVELDEAASKHLRCHIQGKTILNAQPGNDPRAVVSAAVCFMLGEDGPADDHLTAALARNKRFYGKPVVQQHPPVAVDIDLEAANLLALYCRKTGEDARDVASGMLYSMLACVLWDKSYSFGECVASAKSRRHSRVEREKVFRQRSKHQRKEDA